MVTAAPYTACGNTAHEFASEPLADAVDVLFHDTARLEMLIAEAERISKDA